MKAAYMKILYLLLLFLNFSSPLSLERTIMTKCDGKTIKYSLYANLKEYLENENNVDKRDIYNQLSDLKSKRIGIYKPTYTDKSKLDSLFDSIKEYDNKDNLVTDVIKDRLDGGIIFHGLANSIHINSNILSLFPEPLYSVKLGFGLNKNSGTLKERIDKFINNNKNNFTDLELNWDLVNIEAGYIDYYLDGDGTIKVIAKIDSSPYCYLRQYDNALIGAEVDFIYRFAREYNYKLTFTHTNSYEEQYEALKNGTADLAMGFFVITEDTSITFSNDLYNGNISLFVRKSNLPESLNWASLHNSIKELNGEKLGMQTGAFFDELISTYFPKSEIESKDLVSDLLKLLLKEEIEGLLLDKPVADYLSNKYSGRITYYELENFAGYKNGFAFKNNTKEEEEKEEKTLVSEFNEFLKTINLKEIYEKWTAADYENDPINTKFTIDKDLDPKWPLLTVGAYLDIKPISFYEQNEPKGIEIEILYKFAKENKKRIEIIRINSTDSTERLTKIQDGTFDITLGAITITEEREKIVDFSDPLYDSPIVLLTRIPSKSSELPIQIQDELHEAKPGNNVDVNVNFSGKVKTSSCVFPSFYSDEILINCTINDIEDVDATAGFEYLNTTDKILLYSNYYEANNFLQANSKISGHSNIIKESDKSKIICASNLSIANGVVAGLILFILIPFVGFIIKKFI